MGFTSFFSRQARRPSGAFGRYVMSFVFDKGNAFLNKLLLDAVAVQNGERVLEIGCGTGRLIGEMASSIDRGYLEGVDFSDAMVAIAEKRNRRHIESGLLRITKGDFDEQYYESGSFDKVCGVNVLYFWSQPETTIRKILQVLAPGGAVALAFEDVLQLQKRKLSSEVFRLHTVEEVLELFADAGFVGETEAITRKRGKLLYHCVVARKPHA